MNRHPLTCWLWVILGVVLFWVATPQPLQIHFHSTSTQSSQPCFVEVNEAVAEDGLSTSGFLFIHTPQHFVAVDHEVSLVPKVAAQAFSAPTLFSLNVMLLI